MMDLGAFKGKRICVALSGGADSVCLLHLMKEREAADGFALSAVHCEHGIRGTESLADAAFAGEICSKLGVPFFYFEEDCPALARERKESLETAARTFRQGAFRALVEEGKADFIATAHHAGDEAETVLFRLCRGTALAGARGMEAVSGFFLRPLLTWNKAQILRYLSDRGIEYREDRSNYVPDVTRNKIRLEILPKLEEAVPGAAGNLARFARVAAEDDDLLQRLSGELIFEREPRGENDSGICLKECGERALFRRAALSVLKRLGVEKDYTAAHLESLFALQKLQVGSRINLPKGVVAVRDYDSVRFLKENTRGADVLGANACGVSVRGSDVLGTDVRENGIENRLENSDVFSAGVPFGVGVFAGGMVEVTVERAGQVRNENAGREGGARVLLFDLDRVPAGAVIRFAKAGDRFCKFGGGTKALSRYLIDKKIPQAVRNKIPLIAESDGGEVYVVCGVEIADGVKVTEKTGKIACVSVKKVEGRA